MRTDPIPDLIRRYYAAYETKDRQVVEALLTDDFTFSSPLDDRIDRQAYFARCWPNSAGIRAFHIAQLLDRGDDALVLYELELNSGSSFKNVEHFTVAGGRIKEVAVYFGSLPKAGLASQD